jgi:hypothetical protein
MTTLERNFVAIATQSSGILYGYNDPDDIKSVRRWLKRELSPATDDDTDPGPGEPFVFVEPIIGTFKRPAVTVRQLPVIPRITENLASTNYQVEHSFVLTAYGDDYDETFSLGERMRRMISEGSSPLFAPYRIPLWAFDLDARLARWMQVVPDSVQMELAETNEQGMWQRSMNLRVKAGRRRGTQHVPAVKSIGLKPSIH